MRISGTFELVLRLLRTSSKLAENLFKIPGDAHQMGNSLGQGKKFSWAREIRPNYFTALWNTLLDRHLRFCALYLAGIEIELLEIDINDGHGRICFPCSARKIRNILSGGTMQSRLFG